MVVVFGLQGVVIRIDISHGIAHAAVDNDLGPKVGWNGDQQIVGYFLAPKGFDEFITDVGLGNLEVGGDLDVFLLADIPQECRCHRLSKGRG